MDVVKLTEELIPEIFPHATIRLQGRLRIKLAEATQMGQSLFVHHNENWFQMVRIDSRLEDTDEVQEKLHNPGFWSATEAEMKI